MSPMSFHALRVDEVSPGKFERSIVHRQQSELPDGELLVRVIYSSLNYKDALSATGNKGITKKYPHTPGIDAAGVVEMSNTAQFRVGDEVVVMGHDLGMNTHGGWAAFIRVPAAWAIPRPPALSLFQCMVIGTAGFTAASALYKMQLMGQRPSQGPVVVSGASGGVGSLAVAILSRAGYQVIAVSGKEDAKEYLHSLGASKVEPREFLRDVSGKSLLRSRWAGAIDTVGGGVLETLLKACGHEGNVVSTGMVGSAQLALTVFPFILNGVNLLGIGSAETGIETRRAIWSRLCTEWNINDLLAIIAREATLEELNNVYIDQILRGKLRGRVVVRL